MNKRLIVVDVSNFIFRAFFAIRPLTSPDGVPVNAVHGVLNMFLKLLSQYQPSHMVMALDTAGGSFRNEMYPEYKANRSEPPEDLIPQFDLIRQLLVHMELPSIKRENFEADDIIGSVVTQWKDEFEEILIASGDKDLMQFVDGPIRMLDTMKDHTYDRDGVFTKMGVYPEQIVDYLSMVGDASDNIPGMRGIGAKGAAKLLAEHGTLDACIEQKETFKGKKLTTAFSEYLDDGLLSRKLIEIKTDLDLGHRLEEVGVNFYPQVELINFLKGLGFKSSIKKLEELKQGDYEASLGGDNAGGTPESHQSFDHQLIENKNQLNQLQELIDSHEVFSCHTEFDLPQIFARNLKSLTFCFEGQASYHADVESFDLETLHELLKRAWGQNALVLSEHWKRDFFYSFHRNIPVSARAFDVTQAHYVYSPDANHQFESICAELLQESVPARDKKDPCMEKLELKERQIFCGGRACLIFNLYKELKELLRDKHLLSLYNELDMQLIPILSQMEKEGINLDQAFFKKFAKELQDEINVIEKEISTLADNDEINLNSPKQVAELLFEKLKLPTIKKTKTGHSTDSEVLEKLKQKGLSPIPGKLLKYREVGKLLSTYVGVLPDLVNPESSRLHTHFNQHVAATGRLSSNNPNLQNIPVRTELGKKVRQGFISAPGHVLMGADYSQVELRLLAHFSGDPVMLEAFNNDLDIHRQTASEVMGVPLDQVTSEMRGQAKAVNFGLMYGQSSFGLASQLGISRTEAKEYITNYFSNFAQVKIYLDSLKELAEKKGYSETLLGRKRFLPDINSQNRTQKAMAERVAINSPIQGTAADIIKLAMINIDRELKNEKLDSRLLLQVHDELIFEVPEKEIDVMEKLIREGMETVVELKVPLKVELSYAKNWFDLK